MLRGSGQHGAMHHHEPAGLTSSKGQLPRLDVLHPHPLPVQQVAQPLGPIPLVDALPLALRREVEHAVGQLIHRIVHAALTAVHDVDAVIGRIGDQLLHVASEARQVRRDARDAHDRALGRRVPPGLVIRGEHPQMRAPHEVVIIQRQDGIGGVEKLRVEHDLDPIAGVVEQLHAADLTQNRILGVVGHVVGHDRGESLPFHAEQPSAQHDAILAAEEILGLRGFVPFVPLQRSLEQPLAHFPFDHAHGVPQGFNHRLPFQGFHGQGLRLRRHDDEGDDRHLRLRHLEAVIQPRQGLNEHVHAFVPVLVSPGGEEIQRVLGLEIDVAVEMTAHEIMNLLLVLLMQVLELVHGREFLDVEAIGDDAIRLPLQEVLALVGRDVGDRGEDVGRVTGGPLDAVSMIDPPLPGFGVDVKVL